MPTSICVAEGVVMWGISRVAAGEIVLTGLAKRPTTFKSLFLRDACSANGAVDSSTRQKTFTTPQVLGVAPTDAKVEGDHLHIKWSDGHSSNFSREWLERYASLENSLAYRGRPQKWTAWKGDELVLHKVKFQDFMAKGPKFSQACLELAEFGLVQITDIPHGELSASASGVQAPTVEHLATTIGGYPKTTFYGTSWNVRSVKQARNVAYTSVFLPLHMDLLYYESPPGLQLLHVVENTCTGGESYFADSYAAALHIRRTDPEAYRALTSVPLSYHYVNDGQHYFQMRPVIVEDKYAMEGEWPAIDHFNYSPPFQAPLDALGGLDDKTLAAFERGLAAFETFVEDPTNQIQFRMQAGTCIVFYNRRALHARREFDATSGDRFFKGTYTDIDAFDSTVRELRKV